MNRINQPQLSSLALLDKSRITGHFNANKYLHARLSHKGLATHSHDLLGHYGCVNTISFSNQDQGLLCSGSDDTRVLVWRMLDNPGKKHIKEFRGHVSNIFHAVFDGSNKHLLSCSNDQTIKYYDVEASNNPISSMDHHTSAVYRLSYCPTSDNLFLSASEDHNIFLWDLRERRRPKKLVKSLGAFNSVHWSPQGPYFVTANSRSGVQLWDIRTSLAPRFLGTNAPVIQYVSRYRHVSGASFNSDGTQIVASIRRGGPTLYDVNSSFPVNVFLDPQFKNSCTMKSCSFLGNYDEFVASGSDDFRVYIWRIPGRGGTRAKSPLKDEQNNNTDQNNTETDMNDEHAPETNEDDVPDGKTQNTASSILLGHRSIVNNVAWNNNLGLLCSAGVEKVVKVWSTFPLGEDDEVPRVSRPPRDPHPEASLLFRTIQGSWEDEEQENVQESESTLRLFDLWLEMDAHGIGESDSDEDDTALFRRASAFGEEGGEEEYSFEIQDSSSSDEDMTLNIDADDDEDDDDEEDDDEGDGLDSGEGWKLFKTDEGQYIVEMQDSDGETFYVDVGDIAEASGEEEEEEVQEKKSKPRKRERESNNNNRREKKRNRKPPKGTKEKPEKKKRKKLRK